MGKKRLLSLCIPILWCIMLLVLLMGATYAWFTFDPYTNVEPLSGTVGDGDTTLLIAANPDDIFSAQCLLPKDYSEGLLPVSTSDLQHFYRAYAHDRLGIALSYKEVTESVEEDVIHGKIYLKSLKDDCNVYLYQPQLYFGEDDQMLAALRLGLRFTTQEGVDTYIFSLDDWVDGLTATEIMTTPEEDVVVSGIVGKSSPEYIKDIALGLNRYSAIPNEERPKFPKPGEQKLCTLQAEEIGEVEYWLYLEGCDSNCINEVQNREVSLQLSFAGVTVKPKEEE